MISGFSLQRLVVEAWVPNSLIRTSVWLLPLPRMRPYTTPAPVAVIVEKHVEDYGTQVLSNIVNGKLQSIPNFLIRASV